jgi:HK97 family phage major capsid protein
MKAYKYSSRLILVPIELLQDAGVDIEAYVVKMLAIRLGRILNTHFTSGSGTSQPRGVLADAVTGKTGAGGQVTTIIYDDIVDLKYSVNRSYRGNGRWMMNDSTLQYILKIKDQNLRPLILDYLTTLQEGEPERLLGQPLIVNNDMPALGTTGSPAVGNQSLLYGDFSNYWVRRVMAMLLLRLVERFAEAGQVAFVAFLRMDGRMIDAGTHPIKAYVNPTA